MPTPSTVNLQPPSEELLASLIPNVENLRGAKLDNALETEIAKILEARRSSAFLGEYVFGWENKWFHDRWHEIVNVEPYWIIFASVEHGKSWQLAITRPLWEIGNNVNTTGAIISETAGQSQERLAAIAQTIQTNPRYQAVFPWVREEKRKGRIQKWGSEGIIVERDDPTVKDPTVQAAGIEGAILGARLRWCLLDDPLSFKSTFTEGMRQKTFDWFRSTVIGRMLDRPGSSSWVGWILTAWDEDDAAHRLEREGGFTGFRFPAHSVGDPASEVLWPEAFPPNRLADRRRVLGEFEYARQFLCQVTSDARRIFQREWLAECRRLAVVGGLHLCASRPDWADGWRVGVGVDLAIQKGKEADLTALFTLAFNPLTEERRVVSIESGQWEFPEIVHRIKSTQERFGPEFFVIEDNAFQAALVQHLRHTTAITVVGHTTGRDKWDPDVGVQAMAPAFEFGKWRLPEGDIVDKLIRGFANFRPGQHTMDEVMACWLIDNEFSKQGRVLSRPKPAGL